MNDSTTAVENNRTAFFPDPQRDLFAVAALPLLKKEWKHNLRDNNAGARAVADSAYRIADAMLARRQRQ